MIELAKDYLCRFLSDLFPSRPYAFLVLACAVTVCTWLPSTARSQELSAFDELKKSGSSTVEIIDLQVAEEMTRRHSTPNELFDGAKSIRKFQDGTIVVRENGESVIVKRDQDGKPKVFTLPQEICVLIPWVCMPAPPN